MAFYQSQVLFLHIALSALPQRNTDSASVRISASVFISHEFISTNRRYQKSLLFNFCYSQSTLKPYLLFESVLPSSMKPPAPSTSLPTELNLLKEPSQREVSKRKYTLGLIGVWTLLLHKFWFHLRVPQIKLLRPYSRYGIQKIYPAFSSVP